jgi:hypothetical protein
MELALVQAEVERIGPIVRDHADRIDDLEASRDRIKGMFIVLVVLQSLVFILVGALFGWGLNHMTFHSDYEPREPHSSVQSQPTDSQMTQDEPKEIQAPIVNDKR